ncbi:MAG: T9SS type A sorting domain-containing protein [Bacteroidales bacterium]|nr:T9SS type A sorting domain-containing protein [Bacteroidales bacterium]
MKTNSKIGKLVLALCLLPCFLSAQEVLTGFYRGENAPSSDRQVYVQTLPFYDDFSSSTLYPDSTKWKDRYAFVNSGFPLNPVTRNAATLDVLDAKGAVYSYAISNPFIAEHLTSTQIRLDSVFDPEPKALSPADSLYLSFYYQPQGNGLPPEANDSLVLEFGIPNDFDTTWYHIWSTPGQPLSQFLQENDSAYFKLVMIPITDPKYFSSTFFFRFYNYASIVNSTQPTGRGNEDNWNIDMVYLDRNRSYDDPSYPKVCFTGQTPSFLKRYKSMPYKHYRTNAYASLNDEYIEMQVSNLDNRAHNVTYAYYVDQVGGGQSYYHESASTINLPQQSPNQLLLTFVDQLFSIDFDRDSTSYLIRHYVSDSTCTPPLTDSLVYHQGFYNYFAYDDGTPEMGYGVEPASSSFAVKFEMAELDTLRGVQILFNRTLNDANEKYFDIVVWKDNNGKPGEEVYRMTSQRPRWGEKMFEFAYYKFPDRVRLSGSFYVGIMQRDNGLINIGVDMSNDNSQYNFFNTSGSWQQSAMPGSLMIRPVVGAGYYIGVDENDDDEVVIYPNPATDELHVKGVENGQSMTVYDMTGRRVLQRGFSNSLDVKELSGGIYLLQITTSEGDIINRKITVKP